MKNTIKKILTVFICICCICTAGCGTAGPQSGSDPDSSQEEERIIGPTSVWTADGGSKILQDKNYSAEKRDDTLRINAFRNEYEEAQIIITAGNDIAGYDITLNDLISAEGDVLKKECFTVFNEKYIPVNQLKNTKNPLGLGLYPDALLPFEKAAEYNENKIKAGDNQGLWISLKAPKTQKAGVYTGSFTVSLDGKNHNVPVEITVYDYTLSDGTGTKSSFGLFSDQVAWGEFDSTVEMYDAYYNFMLDHRVDAQLLPITELTSAVLRGDALDMFLHYANRSALDERCSHYNIPFTMGAPFYTEDGEFIGTVNFDEFENTLREMADYGAKHGVDLFKKAGTYFIFFDEFNDNGTQHIAEYNLNAAYRLCERLAEDLKGKLVCDTCDEVLETEILKHLAGIKHKVVGSIVNNFGADKALFVPQVGELDTASERQKYADYGEKSYGEDSELWTYTCCHPHTPFPTYHIDDILLSSRLLGWMMYDYNIVGNLYWDSAMYSRREADGYIDHQLYDYYDLALRFPSANGDGFLMYPGRPYGIYGPVDTVRFQSIRDGNEDWDLLHGFESFYKGRGLPDENFDSLMDLFTKSLYSGVRVKISENLNSEFFKTRKLLGSLLEMAANTGALIKSYAIDGANAVFCINAPKEVTIFNGEQRIDGTEKDGFLDYAVSVPLSKAKNYFNLKAEKDGRQYAAEIYAGGKSEVKEGAFLDGNFVMTTGGTAEKVSIDGKNSIKLHVLKKDDRATADLNASFLAIDEKSYTNIVFDIYNCGTEDLRLEIRSKCENSSVYDKALTVTLKPGHNIVGITPTELGCGNYGMLKTVRFNLLDGTDCEFAVCAITLQG